jgi:hypothetical protein
MKKNEVTVPELLIILAFLGVLAFLGSVEVRGRHSAAKPEEAVQQLASITADDWLVLYRATDWRIVCFGEAYGCLIIAPEDPNITTISLNQYFVKGMNWLEGEGYNVKMRLPSDGLPRNVLPVWAVRKQ